MAKPILKKPSHTPRKKKNVGFHEKEDVKEFNKDSPVNREIEEPLAHTPTKHVPVVTTDEELRDEELREIMMAENDAAKIKIKNSTKFGRTEHRDRVLDGNSELDEPLIQLTRSVTMQGMPTHVMELKKEPIHVEPKRGFFYRLYDRAMGTKRKSGPKGGRKTRKLRAAKRRQYVPPGTKEFSIKKL
jgi:hypothetical protein